MTAPFLAFLVVAGAAVCGALITLWSRSIVRSAFGLILAFLGVAGVYALLGCAFLAITQLVVYVGGVVVLYLFGVMLTPPDLEERRSSRVTFWAVLGLVSLVLFSISLFGTSLPSSRGKPMGDAAGIGEALLSRDAYLLPFEIASVLLLVVLVGAVHLARRERKAGEKAEGEKA